jgi:hypothetical protein
LRSLRKTQGFAHRDEVAKVSKLHDSTMTAFTDGSNSFSEFWQGRGDQCQDLGSMSGAFLRKG